MNWVSAFGKACEHFRKLKTTAMVGVQSAAARDAERHGWPTDLYCDPDYVVDFLRRAQTEATVRIRHADLRATNRSTNSALQRKAKWTSSTSH
jgi:hypothetical protein